MSHWEIHMRKTEERARSMHPPIPRAPWIRRFRIPFPQTDHLGTPASFQARPYISNKNRGGILPPVDRMACNTWDRYLATDFREVGISSRHSMTKEGDRIVYLYPHRSHNRMGTTRGQISAVRCCRLFSKIPTS